MTKKINKLYQSYFKSDDIFKNISLLGLGCYAFLLPFMQNPFSPLFPELENFSRFQITDIIFITFSPFFIVEFFKKKDYLFKNYKLQIFSCIIYFIIIFISIKDFSIIDSYFQLFAALYLILLFFAFLVVVSSKFDLNFLIKAVLISIFLNVCLSLFSLFILYLFDIRWDYIIQETRIFPYLGKVPRLIGPFKPTAKLLASYLTLTTPAILALGYLLKRKSRVILFFIGISSILIYPFTLARGIVGFLFSLTFLSYYFQNNILQRYLFKFLTFITTISFLSVTILSTIYISDINIKYSFDNNLNHPNTQYFYYLPNKGKETISNEISFARDHYFLLKKAALIMIKENPLGVGIDNFQKSLSQLEERKIMPKGLSFYPTPQSQLLFAGSERGILGILSVIFLFISWIYPLFKRRKNLIIFASMGSLFALCFIDSLHLEILRFRFLWFYTALIITYAKIYFPDKKIRSDFLEDIK